MPAKRITPIAVEPEPGAPGFGCADGAEQPLDVGPAPDQGDARAIHPKLGAGRRFWVNIQDSYELKLDRVRVSCARRVRVVCACA
jgi:hypothetical protein